jgi:tRNA (guanine37-N1)-methyltransferase
VLRIDILTIHPALMESPLSHSILKRGQQKGLVSIHVHDWREFSTDKHKSVDDYPYGGGAGMVLSAPPLAACIRNLQIERTYDEVIFLTPDGETLTQELCNTLSLRQHLMLIAGHYKGIDQRIRDTFVTREVSIGDYVLTGGELPALVLTDAIVRLLPGVLGDECSALDDSHQDHLLGAPVYTRPPNWEGREVPTVLLSGHFANIEQWQFEQSIEKTRLRRPDLLRKAGYVDETP